MLDLAGIGSNENYLQAIFIGQRFGDSFPWGTILVNISGSFAIGLLSAFASSEGRLHPKLSPFAAQFFMVGICGGYTTFSTLSNDSFILLQNNHGWMALANSVGSSLLGIAAAALGWKIATSL